MKIIEFYNNSNICIVMSGDKVTLPYFMNTIEINSKYANNLKYDFKAYIGRVLDEKLYKSNYDRYKVILDLMTQSNYEYFMYIDCDACFCNDIKLDNFINMMSDKEIILCSEDIKNDGRILNINTGVLLFKNCDISRNICFQILNTNYKYNDSIICVDNVKFYDQCIIEKLISIHKYFKIIPYGILQNFSEIKNNLIIHLAGKSNEFRTDFFKNIVNKKFSYYGVY